jgi:hypothetical protein
MSGIDQTLATGGRLKTEDGTSSSRNGKLVAQQTLQVGTGSVSQGHRRRDLLRRGGPGRGLAITVPTREIRSATVRLGPAVLRAVVRPRIVPGMLGRLGPGRRRQPHAERRSPWNRRQLSHSAVRAWLIAAADTPTTFATSSVPYPAARSSAVLRRLGASASSHSR